MLIDIKYWGCAPPGPVYLAFHLQYSGSLLCANSGCQELLLEKYPQLSLLPDFPFSIDANKSTLD